jgi:hypothetical protein
MAILSGLPLPAKAPRELLCANPVQAENLKIFVLHVRLAVVVVRIQHAEAGSVYKKASVGG